MSTSLIPITGETSISCAKLGLTLVPRTGLYRYGSFPAVIGKETAGTIVGLPTDAETLNNETYKKNGFAIGLKVATVGTEF